MHGKAEVLLYSEEKIYKTLFLLLNFALYFLKFLNYNLGSKQIGKTFFQSAPAESYQYLFSKEVWSPCLFDSLVNSRRN